MRWFIFAFQTLVIFWILGSLGIWCTLLVLPFQREYYRKRCRKWISAAQWVHWELRSIWMQWRGEPGMCVYYDWSPDLETGNPILNFYRWPFVGSGYHKYAINQICGPQWWSSVRASSAPAGVALTPVEHQCSTAALALVENRQAAERWVLVKDGVEKVLWGGRMRGDVGEM